MVLSETETMAYGNAKPESRVQPQPQQPPPEEESLKDPLFPPLNGNGNEIGQNNSLMSLTLNEIQLKSGKCFGSMNMDEFLANLWSGDEIQVPLQPNQSNEQPRDDDKPLVNQQPLARQGSLSIPAPLCKKTVEEVWSEIQKDQPEFPIPSNSIGIQHQPPRRQQTLGEMTLEDFLIKAGVVQEAPRPSQQKMLAVPHPMQQHNNAYLDPSFGMGPVMGLGFTPAPHHQNVGNTFSVGNGFTPYHMFPPAQTKGYVPEAAPNASKNEKGHNQLMEMGAHQGHHSKKRIIDGPPEVVVERRQRRMIKNRESAARSRARKQAYTVELELELNQLKEENAKLKQFVEEVELKRKEEVIRRTATMPQLEKPAEKLKAIRRTLSLP